MIFIKIYFFTNRKYLIPRIVFSVLLVAAVALTVGVAAGFPLLLETERSNCGGNSAALEACHGYVTIVRLWSQEHGGKAFHYELADAESRRFLTDLPGTSWIPNSLLLARIEDVLIDPSAEKRVVMVCSRAYGNVPQRRYGRSPMTHAVAYSTGETGLISPEEYARLDLTGFVDLRKLERTSRTESKP